MRETPQWCVVRGCVALADHRDVPYLCSIHGDMTKEQRDAWSRIHSFHVPTLVPVDLGRIEYGK